GPAPADEATAPGHADIRAAFAPGDATLGRIDALAARLKSHQALVAELALERDAVLALLPPGANRDPLNAEIAIMGHYGRTLETLKETLGPPAHAQALAYGAKMASHLRDALEQLIGRDSPDRILAFSTAAEMGARPADIAADRQMIGE